MRNKIIGVIGEYQATERAKELAYEVGKLIAQAGYILICGGLAGVMESACKGAKDGGGLTIGVLPGISKDSANPYVDIALPTGLDQARNIIIVRASSVIIAIEGGYGTLSEIAYALKLNIPVIGLNTWEISSERYKESGIIKVKTAKEAVDTAINLIK
jgi:uncharacterized protein (TIGR00725 family)